MAIDLSNWVPRNILVIPNDQPGKIVSAEYWSNLWQTIIEQGDYGQSTLEAMLARLNATAWHPTEGAVSITNPEIYSGGAAEVSGQLSELKAFADEIVTDLYASAWHPTNAAASISAPALEPGGPTNVHAQLNQLNSSVLLNTGNISSNTYLIEQLLYGSMQAKSATMLEGLTPDYFGTATQVTNLQTQIDTLAAGEIAAFNHNDISNRDVANAHPTSAITGLAAALSTIGIDIDTLENTVLNLTHAGFTDRNDTASHTASAIEYDSGVSLAQKIAGIDATISSITGDVSELTHNDLLGRSVADAHSISAITGLQAAIDGKAASSHGTHVSYGTSAEALTSGGAGSAGTASTVSRSDHKHTLPAYPVVTLASLGVSSTAAELNKLHGVTATAAEINCTDGVTSAIQTQLNAKQNTISYGTANPSGGVNGDVYIKY